MNKKLSTTPKNSLKTINFELAELANRKGFNLPTYSDRGLVKMYNKEGELTETGIAPVRPIYAPTYEILIRWLRENRGVQISNESEIKFILNSLKDVE